MKKVLLFTLCLIAMFAVTAQAGTKKKVHTIGDSTMADYATDGSTDKRGWCQMLQQFFDSDQITIHNRGKSGASSKSFYIDAAYWPTLVTGGSDAMSAGDYLIIQFAHNDEKNAGADGDVVKAYYTSIGDATTAASTDYRGTTASGTFKEYIRKYINEAKAMGVKPIVVGAICRKYFSSDGKDITRKGRHDLGDGYTVCDGTTLTTNNKVSASDDSQDYIAQAKAVADEFTDVPFIDLTDATAKLYVSYGESYCTSNIFCTDDSTHPNAEGATLIARTFAQLLKDQAQSETDATKKAILNELAQYTIVSSEISFNPTSGDLGKGYQGQSIVKEFNVSAFGLDAGTPMTITTDGSFLVSTDKQNYSQSLTIQNSGSNIIQSVYVKVNLTNAGTFTGKLTATAGTMTSSIDLTAVSQSLTGAEETTAVWPLTSSVSPTLTGVTTAFDETLTDLAVKQYGTIGSDDAARTMQLLNPSSGKWGASELDEVSTRYAEFKMTCPADYNESIDKISFYVAGRGGSAVSYHAYYSTSNDFSNPVLLDEKVSMTANTPILIEKSLALDIEEGKSLYIRFYPWYNGQSSEATGKYLCLSDLTVHAMATKAGGQAINATGSIAYALVDSEPVFTPETMSVGFVGKTMKAGSSLTIAANGGTTWSGSDSSKTQTKVTNTSGASLGATPDDGNTITFTLTPEDGVVFMPSKVSFQAARYGTDSGVITATLSGNSEAQICDNAALSRSAKGLTITSISNEVSGISADASTPLLLKISVLGLGNSKAIGINDVVIEGTMTGTINQQTKYTLTTNVTPADAGTIDVDPAMTSYKDGTEVTLTAKRNFGYKFKEWQVGGETVSTDASYTVKMSSDVIANAVFDEIPVYTVSTNVTNDADRSIGSITLSPDEHQGKYEEGTEVTAVANTLPILKFLQWTDNGENAGTSATRTFTVNSDMAITANYEVQDFIAVFDASKTQSYVYAETAGYPFAADIAWDENRNAHVAIVKASDGSNLYSQSNGTPVVRNRTAAVLSTINGLYTNGYRSTDIAFQYSFSTKGFTSATFTADMAAKNMANQDWKMQYSLNGTDFTDIDTWSMTANVAKALNVALPAALANQDLVYIRITGTGSEMLSSAYTFDKTFLDLDYCSNSETGIGNVYILGEAEVEKDNVAPEVVNVLPADGTEGVSATGTVTVSYNERISAGNIVGGTATLKDSKGNGKDITATWNSKSVVFQYVGLEYGETYTLTYPAGFVVDRSGNSADPLTVTFKVMDRKKASARTFDAVVDASLTQLDIKKGEFIEATADMPRQYRSIQNAIDAAPANSSKPYLIFVKEGYYNHPNYSFNSSYGTRFTTSQTGSSAPQEKIGGGINEYDSCRIVCVNKPNIQLIGQDVKKVIIATDRFDGYCSDASRVWYHINAGATIEVQENGTDFHMDGITVDNENWTKLQMAGPQALCFNISGDRAVLNNVRARSYQDTYYNGGTYNRSFWNNSEIEGAVDFIYGASDVWFENCTLNINRSTGGFIVAPNHPEGTRWGYVFNNTRITTDDVSDPSTYSIWLGRPWHEKPKTVFLHTTMELTPMDSLWYETMGGLPDTWAVYDFHNKNGYPLSEVSRSWYYYKDDNGDKVWGQAKNSLTAEEVAQYTISNVMAGDKSANASGYWNPQTVVEKTSTPVLTQNNGEITWTKDDYAICYVVTVNGKVVAFPTDARYVAQAGDVITVQSVNEYGTLSDPSEALTVVATTGIDSIAASAASTGRIYNAAGQQVSNTSARGIYVEKGKKMIK